METKTCPNCASVALREYTRDITFSDLAAWHCAECNKLFYTDKGDEDE